MQKLFLFVYKFYCWVSGTPFNPYANLNAFSLKISQLEGGKKQISIAQINEVVRIISDLFKENPEEVIQTLITISDRKSKPAKVETKKEPTTSFVSNTVGLLTNAKPAYKKAKAKRKARRPAKS